jgi:2-amino-4-hydroxy-6-hydroxymethyldihydropteridine diphosphokinase
VSSETWYIYLLAFGSNLGDRAANLERGRSFLATKGTFKKVSHWQETAPLQSPSHDTSDHENYINGVAEFITSLSPRELYEAICEIENTVGHRRDKRWAPRELDIDIVFASLANNTESTFLDSKPLQYHGECGLRIPHTGFWDRPFLIEMITKELNVPIEYLQSHNTKNLGAS